MGILKAKRRVLLIGGEGVVLYAPSGKGMEREISISWDVPDFDKQLTDTLARQNKSRAVVVVFDGADQAYRREDNIPRLSPFDRPRFVRRKLDMAFPGYPIRASLPVRQTRGGAPSYLFAALPETEQLDRIGAALYEAGVPVAGFGLLPVESAGLVTALTRSLFGGTARWSVLIGQHETGGLRQVVVKDGTLALARLTPTSEAGTEGPDWVAEVERGFRETLAYVSRFGYTPEQGLDVVIVCNDIEKQFFDQKKLPVTHLRCLGVPEAMRLIGAKPFGARKSNFADALHAAWVSDRASLTMPVSVPSIHRIMAPRMAARAVSLMCVGTAIGLGLVTLNAYNSWTSIKEELSRRQDTQARLQAEYAQETTRYDALPVRPETIRNALAVKEELETNTADPAPILARLKASFGPDIVISSLTYEHTPGPGLVLQPDGGQARGPLFTLKKDESPRGKVKIKFQFSLPPAVPLEGKVARAEALEQELRKTFPGWDVFVLSQFGKVSRDGEFQGKTGQASSSASAAEDYAEFSMEGVPL